MKALGGRRQLAVGRRFDFKTSVTRQVTGAWIITADPRDGIDIAAAINLGLHLLTLAKTPLAFDDGIGRVDAVDDDGQAGPTRDHDIEAAAGESR
jgi:hypothetical protein